MALFENFPYTNLQQLNLDWIIEQLNNISSSSVLSVNGQTGVVTLYQDADVAFPNVPEDHWSMIRMADGTLRGIMFGNDDKAYIVHGNLMAELYSNNNPPPYPVTRVNGQYGDIELYTEQYVRLPDLTDAQMQNWTFFRMLNNVSHGIQFNDDGTASIINGTSRYVLYTSQNPPPYPVDSVNGQTGTVVLFTDVNGAVGYPAITDPDIGAWSMERNVNGTVYGIRINDDGTVVLKVGNAEYNVYTSHDPQEGYVTDPEDIVQQVTEDSSANYWGIMRDTSEGSIGLMFENADPDNPTAYIAYVDSNDQQKTLQILTPADIPATGVVSVNAKTGIVVLTGEDISVSTNDARTLDNAIIDLIKLTAYYEPTNIATRNYNENQFLVMNDKLYRVTTPISTSDTIIPNTNVTLENNIGDQIQSIKSSISLLNQSKAERWGPGTHTLNSHVKCAGYLTSSGERLHFFYPVPCYSGMTGSDLSITYLTARNHAGYILNAISSLSGLTPSINVQPNGIHIYLTSATSLGDNNTPAEIEIDGTITFT